MFGTSNLTLVEFFHWISCSKYSLLLAEKVSNLVTSYRFVPFTQAISPIFGLGVISFITGDSLTC